MFFKLLTTNDAPLAARALVGACRLDGWAMELQPRILEALFSTMLGFNADFHTLEPLSVDEVLATGLSDDVKSVIVDLMLMLELICHPIPSALSTSVECWADSFGVDSDELEVARDIVRGSTAQAHADFYRHGYLNEWDEQDPEFNSMLERYGDDAYCFTLTPDPDLEGR